MREVLELPSGARVPVDDQALAPYRARVAAGVVPVRLAYAAAHLVMRPSYAEVGHGPHGLGTPAAIAEHVDWEGTMALRRRIAGFGLGIAEAMDTAQRFETGWAVARRLIEETGRLQLLRGFVAGAGTDHQDSVRTQDDLVAGVLHQAEFIRSCGGIPVILPMPQLPAMGASADDYVRVYGAIARGARGPMLVHWLGPMFHAGLRGYFPGDSFDRVMAEGADVFFGCKLSLLDEAFERRTRAQLLERGQIVLTGDDHHFADLIAGEGEPVTWSRVAGLPIAHGAFSNALLGILDAVAAPAGVALDLLASRDRAGFAELMGPCEDLGRHLFAEPVSHYKAGLAFLAWLDGAQENRMLPNHQEHARGRDHYIRAAELAARARVFTDARRVAQRFRQFLQEGAP